MTHDEERTPKVEWPFNLRRFVFCGAAWMGSGGQPRWRAMAGLTGDGRVDGRWLRLASPSMSSRAPDLPEAQPTEMSAKDRPSDSSAGGPTASMAHESDGRSFALIRRASGRRRCGALDDSGAKGFGAANRHHSPSLAISRSRALSIPRLSIPRSSIAPSRSRVTFRQAARTHRPRRRRGRRFPAGRPRARV